MPTNSQPALTATLYAINSKPDRAGGCYYLFRYIDHATGRMVEGNMGRLSSDSNIRQIMFKLNGDSWEPRNVLYNTVELPIREFNRQVKDLPYHGDAEAIAEAIRKGIASPDCKKVGDS